MARYTGWKTVIDDTEKKHRSQNATYAWLNSHALLMPDGTKVSVLVQEQGTGDRWYPYENLVVSGGRLTDSTEED